MIPKEHKEWFWKAVEVLSKSPIVAGDFEIKFCEYNDQIEMVMNYPNPYYGRKKDFAYNEIRQVYYPKDGDGSGVCFGISESCFKNKNNCCTVMALDESNDPLEYSWRTVGNRPFSVSNVGLLNIRECIDKLDDLMRRI